MSVQNRRKASGAFSFGEFVWWMGVVEDRMDPEKMGRYRVRVFGYHTDDKGDIPTEKLLWAMVMMPITSATISGTGCSPTGIIEGSHVMGFFADGHDCQVPIIMGTYGAKPEKGPEAGKGFNDPEGTYPWYDPDSEPDTNRLARNEKISETAVQWRRDNEEKNVEVAFGAKWHERSTPYNARYPFNHVRETESGHIEEFDDTEDAERYFRMHPEGTFVETHEEGSEVHKVKRDSYTIVYGDGFINIKGRAAVNIDARPDEPKPQKKQKGKPDKSVKPNKPGGPKSKNPALSLRIQGNVHIEIDGDVREHVKGNYFLNVDGMYQIQVKKELWTKSDKRQIHEAPRIDLNPSTYTPTTPPPQMPQDFSKPGPGAGGKLTRFKKEDSKNE